MALQISDPDTDETTTGWETDLGGSVDLHERVDDGESPNPAEFCIGTTPNPDGSEPLKFGMSLVNDPLSSEPVAVVVDLRKDLAGGAVMNFTINLRDSAGDIFASTTATDVPETTEEAILNLDQAEIDALAAADFAGGWSVEIIPIATVI